MLANNLSSLFNREFEAGQARDMPIKNK